MAAVGPWYPMYGNDFDSSTDTWNLMDVGAYVRLLNHQWDKGSIPDDMRKVGAILRVGANQAKRIWWIVTDKFPVGEDGQRRNRRMAEIRRDREAFLSEQLRKARAGADARWHGRGHSHGQDTGTQNGALFDARGNASSSSSPEEEKKQPKKVAPPCVPPQVKAKQARPEIPASLVEAIPTFAAMWAERMRTPGPGKKPTPSAEEKQLERLARDLPKYGADAIVAVVEAAAHGGYQGLPYDRMERLRRPAAPPVNRIAARRADSTEPSGATVRYPKGYTP